MSADIRKGLAGLKSQSTNAYDHLKNLIINLASDQAGLQSFEEYSFATRAPPKDEVVFRIRESYTHMKEFETSNRALLAKINVGSPEEPQEPTSLTYVPDLVEEAQVFSKLGVGFGEDEAYRIFKSLCNLSIKKNTRQLRFWGKILGSQRDYFIAEGLADGGEDPGQLSPDTEARGVGANKWNYWAATSLTGDWTQLPLVTPQQIRTARKIKYLFTGDLKKSILTNPIFVGTEAHLLKCQIVRISSSCSIVPKGIYATNADDPKQIEFAENYSFPEVSQLVAKQSWVYFSPALLKNGRISHLRPEGLQEEEAEKELKRMMEKDPLEPRLKLVALNGENWAMKAVDLEDTYRTVGKNPRTVSKGVVGVRSLAWPGWTTAGWEGRYSSIYVGYGHKNKFTYFPREPEAVLTECADREEAAQK